MSYRSKIKNRVVVFRGNLKDMEKEMLFSKLNLKRLIIPLIIEQLLAVTVGLFDTIMVANIGEFAVSAVSLVDTINILLINVFAALGTGGAVVAAQFIGQGNEEKARFSAKQLVLITGIISIVIMAFCLVLNESLLRLIFGSVESRVMDNAIIYFLFSAMSYPFIALYNAGAALFRAVGNSKIAMINSAIMNIINICLNALFIFVFNWGVFGAVLATLIARMVACINILYSLRKNDDTLYIDSYLHFHFDWSYIKKILAIGVPSGLENGMFQLGKILVQSLIATFGTYSIAANAVSGNIAQMMIIPGTALGLAMVTVVGQCMGAREEQQAKYYIKKLMKLTYMAMLVLSLGFAILAPEILKLYSLSGATVELALKCIWIHAIMGIFIWPISFTLPNALRAANDAKFTMVISIVSMWTCRYFLSFYLAQNMGLGLVGVWIAMTLDWVARAIFFVYRYRSGKWKNRKLV